jgi:hypothetical protein
MGEIPALSFPEVRYHLLTHMLLTFYQFSVK